MATATTSLKRVDVSDALKSQPELARAVEEANLLLPEVLGRSAQLVEASWDLSRDDNGRSLVLLALKEEHTGEVHAEFAVDEFENEWRLQRRLYSLWSDLLAVRSAKQLRELHEAVRKLDEN